MRKLFSYKSLKEGFSHTFQSKKNIGSALTISSIIYFVLTLSSFPSYSMEMIGASFFYIDDAFLALNMNIYNTAGVLGIGLSVVYSLVSGIFLLNLYDYLKVNGISHIGKSGGMVPAFVAGGCAGCGAGLLGFLGLLGIASALPFQGNGLKFASTVLILLSIRSIADPKSCDIRK